MSYCFLIPSYQHSQTLEEILIRLAPFSIPCVVVNDGSDSQHSEELRRVCLSHSWVHLFEHESNQGKGGAVITGLFKVNDLSCTHAIQIDSDGQHDLSEVESLINISRKHPLAVVSGFPVYDETVPLGRKIGRYITHFWVWIETLSFEVKDTMCGFRVYPVESTLKLLQKNKIGKRMEFDIEVLVRLFWASIPIRFHEVKVIYPVNGRSNFKLFTDNLLISKMHTKLFFGMLIRLPSLLFNKRNKEQDATHWADIDERGMIVGIRALFLIYKIFGQTVLQFFLKIVCFYYQLFAWQARKASKDFKKTYDVYSEKNNLKPIKINFFSHIYSFADYILDKLIVWQGIYTKSVFNKQDLEKFNQLKKTKGGGLFLGAHFGNIEIARALGRDNLDKKFTALVFTENARKFNDCLKSVNGESTLNIISLQSFTAEVAIQLKERVDRGEWIFITADRASLTVVDRFLDVPVLGRSAHLPMGPFLLGYLLEVPIYSFFCYKEKNKFRIKYKEITPKNECGKMRRDKFINKLALQYGSDLTEKIILNPLQWFNFFMFWK